MRHDFSRRPVVPEAEKTDTGVALASTTQLQTVVAADVVNLRWSPAWDHHHA